MPSGLLSETPMELRGCLHKPGRKRAQTYSAPEPVPYFSSILATELPTTQSSAPSSIDNPDHGKQYLNERGHCCASWNVSCSHKPRPALVCVIDFHNTPRDCEQSPLLHLPAELRNEIYAYVLTTNLYRVGSDGRILTDTRPLLLLRVCRQIHEETATMPISINQFCFLTLRRYITCPDS